MDMDTLSKHEQTIVRELGQKIGYGRIIQIAQDEWANMLVQAYGEGRDTGARMSGGPAEQERKARETAGYKRGWMDAVKAIAAQARAECKFAIKRDN
jgi:hypothetical protein